MQNELHNRPCLPQLITAHVASDGDKRWARFNGSALDVRTSLPLTSVFHELVQLLQKVLPLLRERLHFLLWTGNKKGGKKHIYIFIYRYKSNVFLQGRSGDEQAPLPLTSSSPPLASSSCSSSSSSSSSSLLELSSFTSVFQALGTTNCRWNSRAASSAEATEQSDMVHVNECAPRLFVVLTGENASSQDLQAEKLLGTTWNTDKELKGALWRPFPDLIMNTFWWRTCSSSRGSQPIWLLATHQVRCDCQ